MTRQPWALGALVGAVLVGCGAARLAPETESAGPQASASTPAGAAARATEPPASAELAAGTKAFDAGNYAEARKLFESATKKNQKDYEALYNLGMACEKLDDRPAAEAAYKAALAGRPDLDAAAVALCSLYIDQGRIDDALATGRAALAMRPTSAALHEDVGVALATRGDQDGAAHEFEAAIKLQPSDPMLHLTLAHWLNTWHVRGAAPHLDAARDLGRNDYGMIASVGLEYRMAGEFDSCVKTFDRAIEMKDGGEVRTGRALCKLALKDEKATLEDLQMAVAKEPTYAPAHYYLGGRLAIAKHFKEAAAEYAKYLELAPSGSLVKLATERMKAAQDAAKASAAAKKK